MGALRRTARPADPSVDYVDATQSGGRGAAERATGLAGAPRGASRVSASPRPRRRCSGTAGSGRANLRVQEFPFDQPACPLWTRPHLKMLTLNNFKAGPIKARIIQASDRSHVKFRILKLNLSKCCDLIHGLKIRRNEHLHKCFETCAVMSKACRIS